MFLTDNLWTIFEVAREERTDGDHFEGDMSAAPDLFLNAVKGNEDFACLAGADKDALLKEWEAEDQAERDVVAEREESLKRELEEMRMKKRKLVDPIQYAFSISAEDLATYEPTFAWEMGPMTEKQREYLERHGIYTEEIKNCGMASLVIDKLKNRQIEGLATPKQIRFLERKGFLHVGLWTFEDASRMISRIHENDWIVPRGIDPKTYEPGRREAR